jgi:hypothetical protein
MSRRTILPSHNHIAIKKVYTIGRNQLETEKNKALAQTSDRRLVLLVFLSLSDLVGLLPLKNYKYEPIGCVADMQLNEKSVRQKNGWMDGWMNGWMDGWMD